MKRATQTILAVMLMVLFSFSCNDSENKDRQTKENELKVEDTKSENALPDVSGKYKMPEGTCGFELIITKEKEDYGYNMKGQNGIVDIYGKLTVSRENGADYLNLTLPEGFSSKSVQALFENNTITIQNYGNSMNDYHHFKDCDDKYMEFKK